MQFLLHKLAESKICFALLFSFSASPARGTGRLEILIDGRTASQGDTVQHVGSALQVAGVAAAEVGIARVLVNGEEATLNQATSRDLEVVAMEEEEEAVRFFRELLLRLGDNRITVVATDVEQDETRLDFVVRRVASSTSYSPPGEVYALVVGIDDYADPDIPDLRFAENDAQGVYRLLTDPEYSLARPENVRYLGGRAATADSIKKAMYEHLINQAVRPEDMAIFFYAGHGDVGKHPIKGTEYYMIPQNAELRNLFVTGIVKEDLQRLWSAISARRKIFISDACNSGGFTGMRGRADEGLVEVLGEGKIVFSAARADQKSLELPKLSHGIFTFVLLQGLKGDADAGSHGNGDGLVSVQELAGYMQREVPIEAKKAGGVQNPQIEFLEVTGDIILSRYARASQDSLPIPPPDPVPEPTPAPEPPDLDHLARALEYCNQAEDLRSQGHIQQAILEYGRAVEVYSELERAHLGLAELYIEQGNFAKAVRHARRAVGIDPDTELEYLLLGQAFLGWGEDIDKARDAFQRVLELNPDHARAHVGLGGVCQIAGDPACAVDHFEKAVELEESPETLYHLGSAYISAGRLDEAGEILGRVIAFEGQPRLGHAIPFFMDAHRGLGFIFARKKEFDRAIASYRAALRYDPENADCLLGMGEALFHKEDYQEAAAALERVVEQRKKDARAFFYLGVALLRVGEDEKGEAHIRYVEMLDEGGIWGERARKLLTALSGQ